MYIMPDWMAHPCTSCLTAWLTDSMLMGCAAPTRARFGSSGPAALGSTRIGAPLSSSIGGSTRIGTQSTTLHGIAVSLCFEPIGGTAAVVAVICFLDVTSQHDCLHVLLVLCLQQTKQASFVKVDLRFIKSRFVVAFCCCWAAFFVTHAWNVI